jgi:hypothetical protein
MLLALLVDESPSMRTRHFPLEDHTQAGNGAAYSCWDAAVHAVEYAIKANIMNESINDTFIKIQETETEFQEKDQQRNHHFCY